MKISFRKSHKAHLSLTATLLLLCGCATIKNFLDNSGEQLPAGAFRGTAAIRNQTVPLPVDIAENILAIENGQIFTHPNPPPIHAQPSGHNFGSRRRGPENSRGMGDRHPFSGRRRWSLNSRTLASQNAGASGPTQFYKVENGDTLMKIAFAKYGDVFRWRDIYQDNRNTIQNYNRLVIGSSLVLNGVPFIVIEKNGEPYLIRRGDTLLKISRKLYKSPRFWSALWKNNRQLIRDPNKIYAGFTLYYRPKSTLLPENRFPSSSRQKSVK